MNFETACSLLVTKPSVKSPIPRREVVKTVFYPKLDRLLMCSGWNVEEYLQVLQNVKTLT